MKNNIYKYLSDIGLNCTKYELVPNNTVIEQYDFNGEDNDGELVKGSISRSFNGITIDYITQDGIRHLFTCNIKSSSIDNYISNSTHSIVNSNNETEVIKTKSGENIPIKELFNFNYKTTEKQKFLALY